MGEVVIVTGGRNFSDRKALFAFLDKEYPRHGRIDLLVHGDCPSGADMMADEWARSRKVPRALFPANWDGEGRSAGYQRNERMLWALRPHRVIAFPGGNGTKHMVKTAKQKGVPVTKYDPEIEEMLR